MPEHEHLIRRAPAPRPPASCRGPRRAEEADLFTGPRKKPGPRRAPQPNNFAGSRKVSGPRRSDEAALGWALAAVLVVFQAAQTLSSLGVWA